MKSLRTTALDEALIKAAQFSVGQVFKLLFRFAICLNHISNLKSDHAAHLKHAFNKTDHFRIKCSWSLSILRMCAVKGRDDIKISPHNYGLFSVLTLYTIKVREQ